VPPQHEHGRAADDRLRTLVAGFLNSPHVTAWAEAVAATGGEVHLAGRDAPQLPPSPDAPNVSRLSAKGPPLIRSLRMSRALARVAAEVDPDIVHAHWLPEFGWMAAREDLKPLVCSAWGSDVLGVRGIGRGRSKRALAASDLVLVDSAHLGRAVRELAGRDVQVEIVRWGLDLRRFAPGDAAAARTALGVGKDGPLVVSVRGFKPVYNVQLQLEAFARFRELRPDARLLLKGPGPTVPPTVSRAIDRLGLNGSVSTLGGRPPEQMADIYRAADVVLSIPSSDSSPRSVWEALACGRPVVVSDLPWARDELEDGRHAVLTELDASAVAHAVERALGDERLGREARALAEAELDQAACTARIADLYRSVAAGSRRRATRR
jgi:glycosyltransferase involved in cell wall biosynthesis